jgi:hypothetical protein
VFKILQYSKKVYLIEGDSSLECFKQSFTTMAVTTGFNQISNMGKRFLSLMNNNGRGMYGELTDFDYLA